MTSRPTIAVRILATLALSLVLGAYVGGYFWLGERTEIPFSYFSDSGPKYVRAYRPQWLAIIYQPAGKLESWLTKTQVNIYHRKGDDGALEEWSYYLSLEPAP